MQIIAYHPDRLPTRHHPPTPQLILVSRWSMDRLPMRMEKFETFSHQKVKKVFKPSVHETFNEPNDTLSIHQLVFYLFEVAFYDCHPILHTHT